MMNFGLPNGICLIVSAALMNEIDDSQSEEERIAKFKQSALSFSAMITDSTEEAVEFTEILTELFQEGMEKVQEEHMDFLLETGYAEQMREVLENENLDRDILEGTDFGDVIDGIDDTWE